MQLPANVDALRVHLSLILHGRNQALPVYLGVPAWLVGEIYVDCVVLHLLHFSIMASVRDPLHRLLYATLSHALHSNVV